MGGSLESMKPSLGTGVGGDAGGEGAAWSAGRLLCGRQQQVTGRGSLVMHWSRACTACLHRQVARRGSRVAVTRPLPFLLGLLGLT